MARHEAGVRSELLDQGGCGELRELDVQSARGTEQCPAERQLARHEQQQSKPEQPPTTAADEPEQPTAAATTATTAGGLRSSERDAAGDHQAAVPGTAGVLGSDQQPNVERLVQCDAADSDSESDRLAAELARPQRLACTAAAARPEPAESEPVERPAAGGRRTADELDAADLRGLSSRLAAQPDEQRPTNATECSTDPTATDPNQSSNSDHQRRHAERTAAEPQRTQPADSVAASAGQPDHQPTAARHDKSSTAARSADRQPERRLTPTTTATAAATRH